jgi:hypothetical protein
MERDMKARQQASSRSNGKLQLRGQALDDRIEAVIGELAELAQESGRPYVFNASEVARKVPTTRKSIAKHEERVGRVLEKLDATRRLVTGDATIEHFREQIAHLKSEIAQRDKTILALRSHHVEIYRRFYGASLEGEMLLRPILEQERDEARRCLLCGAGVEGDHPQHTSTSNVIPLTVRKHRRSKGI